MQLHLPPGKTDFSIDEAAALLGFTVRELHALVSERLAGGAAYAPSALSSMRFRPADLVLLDLIRRGTVLPPGASGSSVA